MVGDISDYARIVLLHQKKRMDQTDMYFYGANLVRILFDQWLYDIIIGLLPWETTLDHLNYGNYLRYTLIIVTGITTAYCANRIINKITARL